jgi:membrane protein implicated in regulation of membrane protease activity
MNWELFYLVCFVVGFTFSVLSFVGGLSRFHLHVPKHIGGNVGGGHIGGHTAHTTHGPRSGTHGGHFPIVNPATMAAFLTWFGGTGYLLIHVNHVVVLVGFALATLAGAVGGTLVFLFVGKVLMRDDGETDPLEYEMVGVLANVSSPIRAGGTGEIIFTQQGARRSSAARHEGGESLSKGEEVVVLRYEKGVAYVRRWDELATAATGKPEEKTNDL